MMPGGDAELAKSMSPRRRYLRLSLSEHSEIPVQRFGRPEEVSSIVALLASNGYITNQIYSGALQCFCLIGTNASATVNGGMF